jgi:protein TonB
MTLAATATAPRGPAPNPWWIKPAALVVALAVHGAFFVVNREAPRDISSAIDTLDVSLEPAMGEVTDENAEEAPDQTAQEAVEAPAAKEYEDKPMEEPLETPTPPKVEEVSAEAPKVEEETAPEIKLKAPEEIERPVEKVVEDRKPPPPRVAQEASTSTARAGQENGRRVTASARAAYAGRLNASVRRHTRGVGISGSTVVGFVVGAWGGMSSVYVSRSSGHQIVDDAAVRAVRSAHAGPPPGGAFEGHITINLAVN